MAQPVADAFTAQPTVLKQGLLRKLKTMKKRYFILRGESPGSPARLEYYASEKKFKDGKSQPRKTIELRSCLGIGATASSRASFAIAVHTRDDWLAVGFDGESERDEWLAAMHQVVGSSKCCGGVGSDFSTPMFEHVWIINLRPKGLGRGLAGLYRLCLTDRTLSLVKRASSEANLTFPLEVMRRCGHTDNFFFVEVGRQASTGEGELWMEAEDALIAQSAHYAVQRAMHATKDGTVSASSVPVPTSTALPPGSTATATMKAPDGGSADHRHGSVSSTSTEAAVMRRPESDQSPSPQSRFSTGAISLLTRRLSSKSKPSASSTAGTPPASIITNGTTSVSMNSQEWSAQGAGATASERETRLLSVSQLDHPAAVAGATDVQRNSTSRVGHRDVNEMAARSSSPVPAIEITTVSKDSDDPYFDMSVHDLSTSGGLSACTDYMDMTPRSAAGGTESAPSHAPADSNYLAMLPCSATGSTLVSPSAACDDLPSSDATLSSFGKALPPVGGQLRSPRCPSRDGGSGSRPALKGSQQQLLPDLFSLMPGGSGIVSCGVPSAGPGSSSGPRWSPTGSTVSCNSVSARSTASLGVPSHVHWSDTDGGGGGGGSIGIGAGAGSRLRTGSDAPTHRAKVAKQRSPSPPDRRQRSSSHGCVIASLDTFGQSKLSSLRQAVARGLSESVSSAAECNDDRAGSSLPGSYEYVAMDFSEPARGSVSPAATGIGGSAAGQLPPLAATSAMGAAAAAASYAPAGHKLPLSPSAVEGTSSGTSIVITPASSSSAEQGDYVGIDFGKAQLVVSGGGGAADASHRLVKAAAAATAAAAAAAIGVVAAADPMSEPFPELSCSPVTAEAQEPHWPAPPLHTAATAHGAHARSRSRDSSLLPFADGPHPAGGSSSHFVPAAGSSHFVPAAGSSHFVPAAGSSHFVPAGSGSLPPLTLALDDRSNVAAATDEAYVMCSRAAARCDGPAVAPARSRVEDQHGDAYAELDVRMPAGRSSHEDASGSTPPTLLLPPLPLPGQGGSSVHSAAAVVAVAGCDSGDSYAVMNFSSDAQQAGLTLPLAPQPSAAKAVAAAALASAREQLPYLGESGDCGGACRQGVQLPGGPSPSAATSLAVGVGEGPQLPNGGGGSSSSGGRPSSVFSEAAASSPSPQRGATVSRLAMPVRATCYIKDDGEDYDEDGGGSSSSRRTAAADRTSVAGSNGQHSQKFKAAGASRATAAARPRPSSVSFPAATQPMTPAPPPVPDRLTPPAPASAAAGKLRHASGSELAVTVINYATLDLDAECPPRSVTSAPGVTVVAAGAARPMVRPSSGSSLVLSSDGGSGARSPPGPAGSGVQYSRIDFAKVEALRTGKT